MLESRNLSVFYGRHRAVENVSVTVSTGEIVVMLGANGAGKSTLVKILTGVIRHDAGTIAVNGEPAKELSAPANARGQEQERFDVTWLCPFCTRNVLRSFRASALSYREA